MATLRSAEEAERRAGFIASVLAYSIWGFLPVYLRLLGFVDAREVLGLRILWSIPSALAGVALTGGFAQVRVLTPRLLAVLAASAIFIFGNWAIYVWAVFAHRIMEAALAYFISPLATVGCGVLFFKEKLRPGQAVAIAIAAAGVIAQGFARGAIPYVSLALAASWTCYALVRKQAPVTATAGFLTETLWLAPIGIGLLIWTAQTGPLATAQGLAPTALLALSGPLTMIPLVLFAYGARRVSFGALGVLQFLAPTLQFGMSVMWGEPFTTLHAVSFGLIWAALLVFTWDSFRTRGLAAA